MEAGLLDLLAFTSSTGIYINNNRPNWHGYLFAHSQFYLLSSITASIISILRVAFKLRFQLVALNPFLLYDLSTREVSLP